ncbi:hypothetical protein BV25DRAFT_120759 [Artomyces pyxidatus]|uniref:Uncharacterized protein n=1 Tax=Artomyces pyxidatus TaxID=48021 RepID=A0ACB8TLG4_9AGAM|nr:hypothetical protein BV25DRAFT_120759 [Artomyces pyxidatus]
MVRRRINDHTCIVLATTMVSLSPARNVYVFNASNVENVAGFYQHGSVSIAIFVLWMRKLLTFPPEWALYHTSDVESCLAEGDSFD